MQRLASAVRGLTIDGFFCFPGAPRLGYPAAVQSPMTKEAITLAQLGELLDERNAHAGQE